MSRWSTSAPVDDALETVSGAPGGHGEQVRVAPDLADLPIAGITRRRMAILLSALLAAWIVIAFARQVGEASDATARAQVIASTNAAMRIEVAGLERELDLIARQRYIEQQARAYGLGGSREVPFTLAADAPPLPDDAPGSAALRVGPRSDGVSPLERWLTVLFGPSG
jgi:cell division protein FtsB